MTLLHAGLRVSELGALTTSDLTLNPRSGKLIVRRGKGMKYREVPLNAPVREALATWLKHHPHLHYPDRARFDQSDREVGRLNRSDKETLTKG
jgi:site-specific recombinase XerC